MDPHRIEDSDSLEALMLGGVKAGFPSPAEDVREKLDLVKLLVRHSASTFFFRIDGVSMVDADMDEGDIIIVDRAVEPYDGCKAVCFIDGDFTVKRILIKDNEMSLVTKLSFGSKTFLFTGDAEKKRLKLIKDVTKEIEALKAELARKEALLKKLGA